LKKERIKKQIYKNRELAVADVAHYIDSFYNSPRRHSHLGGVSPEQFEEAHNPPRRVSTKSWELHRPPPIVPFWDRRREGVFADECVQERQTCSVGDSPTGGKVRNLCSLGRIRGGNEADEADRPSHLRDGERVTGPQRK